VRRAAVKGDKRRSRAAKKAQAEAEAAGLACQVCGAAIGSRSKLFKHIQEEGHAALKK
jgi:DnaJ family protein A protein 5